MFKKIAILLLILLLTGCSDTKTEKKENIKNKPKCDYEYTYSCGYDIFTAQMHCGYGYFLICQTDTEEE